MTKVKKRSAAPKLRPPEAGADPFSGLKRLKENVEHLESALDNIANRKNSAR
jgi:hypothetical protein